MKTTAETNLYESLCAFTLNLPHNTSIQIDFLSEQDRREFLREIRNAAKPGLLFTSEPGLGIHRNKSFLAINGIRICSRVP